MFILLMPYVTKKGLFSNWTHFVPLCHITYLFLSYWINRGKCLAANRVHKFIVDEKLLNDGNGNVNY